MKNQITKILFLIIIFLFLPNVSLAVPSISGVSGETMHNNNVTLSGNEFGTKSIAAPDLWDTVENQYIGLANGQTIPTGLGQPWNSQCQWDGGACVKYGTTAGEQRGVSTAIYKTTNSNFGHLEGHELAESTGDIYVSWWFKPESDPVVAGGSWKFLRLSDKSDYVFKTFSWTQMHNYVYIDGCPSFTPDENWDSYTGTPGEWNFHEVWIDSEAKIYVIRVNGSVVNTWDFSQCGTVTYDAVWIIGQDADGNPAPSRMDTKMDDIYVDNTFSRVMIGDAPTYSASTHFEMQIPTAWSASSISFDVNQGTFVNGSIAYLYVVDSSGAVNANGYLVTVGAGSSDTMAPDSPSGLSVL